jgi:hypothetical protein
VATLRDSLSTDKGMNYVLDKLSDVAEDTVEIGIIAKARKDIVGARGELVPVMTRKNVESLALDFIRRNKADSFGSMFVPVSNVAFKKK